MAKHQRLIRFQFLIAALAGAALIAGCGDGDSSTAEETVAASTPNEAIAEIREVRAGLADGLSFYTKGQVEKADEVVGDAYLEHYELVEHPLEERDEELNEELELLISSEIRQQMKDGVPPKQVGAMVAEANDKLTEAEKALQG